MVDLAVLDLWLDSVILKAFYNISDSMTLYGSLIFHVFDGPDLLKLYPSAQRGQSMRCICRGLHVSLSCVQLIPFVWWSTRAHISI